MINFLKPVLIFLSTLLLSLLAGAQSIEPWQKVIVPTISWTVAARPLPIPPDYQYWSDVAQSKSIAAYPQQRANALKNCPRFLAIVEKIYNRILTENQLENFVQSGPGMRVIADCDSRKAPVARVSSEVVIPQRFISFIQNDDELAFVIGHEMAHVLQGHPQILWSLEKEPASSEDKAHLKAVRQSFESEADRLGAFLMINAGYSPQTPSQFAKRIDWYEGVVGFVLERTIGYFVGTHGNGVERSHKIKAALASQQIKMIIKPAQASAELLSAKLEARGLKSR